MTEQVQGWHIMNTLKTMGTATFLCMGTCPAGTLAEGSLE